ncbi:LysM peptidoglycan-binding domain-containing protein [Leucobacter sp. BZR 635]
MTATANVVPFRLNAPVSPRIAASGSRPQGEPTAQVSSGQPRLRLTRRGRVVFGSLATVLVAAALGVAAAFAAPGAIANSAESTQAFPYVFVQAGDSVWSIASELEPTGDPREVVSEIVRLNQMQASDLQAGDSIAVPMRFEGNDLTFVPSGR